MEYLENDYELAQYLQSILIDRATDGPINNEDYSTLRTYFLNQPSTNQLLPSWIKPNRDLSQFWNYIQPKFPSYKERRQFIWQEFSPLLDYLEQNSLNPIASSVSEVLEKLDEDNVNLAWKKALERRTSDPEGAITMAKSMVESVCKLILDDLNIQHSNSADLPQLYHLVSEALNLSPNQHLEIEFKKILGSCSTVVNSLATLRNKLGDAHGKGRKPVKPAPRHSALAVNLAGSVSLFLVETWEKMKNT